MTIKDETKLDFAKQKIDASERNWRRKHWVVKDFLDNIILRSDLLGSSQVSWESLTLGKISTNIFTSQVFDWRLKTSAGLSALNPQSEQINLFLVLTLMRPNVLQILQMSAQPKKTNINLDWNRPRTWFNKAVLDLLMKALLMLIFVLLS